MKQILRLDHADAGVRSIVQLVSGNLTASYLGLTPFVIANRYGLSMEISGVSNRIGLSHRVVLHATAGVSPLVAVPFRSTAHQIAVAWQTHEAPQAQLIDLPPMEAVLAYEGGLVDGIALWEPFLTSLNRESSSVFSGASLDVPLWNVLASPVLATDDRDIGRAAIRAAHVHGVEKLRNRDVSGDDLDYLGAVLKLNLDREGMRSMILDDHEWALIDQQEISAELQTAVESAHSFAEGIGIPESPQGRAQVSHFERRGVSKLGYSPSIMCAPLHLAVLDGVLEQAGLQVEFGTDISIERTARLSIDDRHDVIQLTRELAREPSTVALICGQRVEQRLRELSRAIGLTNEPRSPQALLQELYELDLLPRGVFTGTSFILTLRVAVQHESGSNASLIDSQYALTQLSRFFQWSADMMSQPRTLCHRCRRPVDQDSAFCPNCGLAREASCPECGRPWISGEKFCRSCGASSKEN